MCLRVFDMKALPLFGCLQYLVATDFGTREGTSIKLENAFVGGACNGKRVYVYDLPNEFKQPPALWREQERQGSPLTSQDKNVFADLYNTDQVVFLPAT